MSDRVPAHRYRDPLDHIWLTCAARVGLRVARGGDVYAATDGGGVLTIGDPADLDPDDCLAQMILHEICHWLVEGPDAVDRADWGLDNTGARDVSREHACLRLQATLASPHGLRRVLAPTTDFRAFYDALGADPLEPRHDPSVIAAVLGARRAQAPPWAPHVSRALEATASIARQTAALSDDHAGDELPTLWRLVEPAPPAHPLGLPPAPADPARRCGTCAWRYHGGRGRAVERCRQADGARLDPRWPACARFEPALDCQQCGACCRAAYDSVELARSEPMVTRRPDLVRDRGGYLELARAGDRCAALEGGPPDGEYRCVVYEDRPRSCRDFERGGEHCLTARRRVGLSF